jgi:hypothetical protein
MIIFRHCFQDTGPRCLPGRQANDGVVVQPSKDTIVEEQLTRPDVLRVLREPHTGIRVSRFVWLLAGFIVAS